MHATFSALILALPLTALANYHEGSLRRRHQNIAHGVARRAATYTLQDHYVGEDFLQWDFFDQPDPTGGLVNYVNAKVAEQDGLAYVDCNNVTVLAVDDTSTVASGGNRNSVRISSPKTYNSGLFVADFAAMPTGCSLWPAFWMVGSQDWPTSGELDIIEGVNKNSGNQVTAHSSATCTIHTTPQTSSNLGNADCTSSSGNNNGCEYVVPSNVSFGAGFNGAGGGVYALNWDSSALSVYFFSRNDIPQDIQSASPDPSSWGLPVAVFPSSMCDLSSHFYDMAMVIDTTICGDWAGSAYSSSGCPGSCADAVANATNYADAKWRINYISVYQ